MKKYMLVLIITLLPNISVAHLVIDRCKDFGNIKTRIIPSDSHNSEKVDILGRLAEQLVCELEYTGVIFLDFYRGSYLDTDDSSFDCFVSFDDGTEFYSIDEFSKFKDGPVFDSEVIIIRQMDSMFDIAETLKLIEYAIFNLAEVKSKQSIIERKLNDQLYCINSIDTNKIRKIARSKTSSLVRKVLQTRIFRPEDSGLYRGSREISYFYENGEYVFYSEDYNGTRKNMLRLKDFYEFKPADDGVALVFDTKNTFYYVCQFKCSKRHTIENLSGHCDYYVSNMGGGKISVCLTCSKRNEGIGITRWYRTLIYRIPQDDLIQDLDKILEEQ